MMEPMATEQAMAEPVRAAKKAQTTMVTRARPPVILPKIRLKTRTSRLAIPPAPINSPARINRGTHIMVRESTEEIMRWATMETGIASSMM